MTEKEIEPNGRSSKKTNKQQNVTAHMAQVGFAAFADAHPISLQENSSSKDPTLASFNQGLTHLVCGHASPSPPRHYSRCKFHQGRQTDQSHFHICQKKMCPLELTLTATPPSLSSPNAAHTSPNSPACSYSNTTSHPAAPPAQTCASPSSTRCPLLSSPVCACAARTA